MNAKTQQLLDRTFSFGVNILKFLSSLSTNKIYDIPKIQLARAATSIGANYEEAQAGQSKRDFSHKISIVCKEVREKHLLVAYISTLVWRRKVCRPMGIFFEGGERVQKHIYIY